ncbi:DUF4232 domain-containing protein [Arthrobacter sp. PAMC25284]|uniref:DUF4232 domain-containing protein n=1 Tax=Arthrobacter sp. PAMC25284 TaxID=2861279 RepID=UPI001C632A92|nr:DUF4232 domain-containing protein [Arthrobacter sp. PAMC25284]QYF88567.1 DUF4232 domain-containing protein [Arthrobacter sp. PAMC25284]
MRSQRIKHVPSLATATVAAALLLSGCGGGTPQAATGPVSPTDSASASASATESSASPSSTSSPSSQASTQAGPALCKADSLTALTDASGGGAAGSVYMQLILSNSGTEPCLLQGFAGVSLTAGADGEPIGAAATRDESSPVADVLLAPGEAGTAVLRYTQARNYADCEVVAAAGYRIYPPNDTASLFLPQPTDACSNPEISLLTIGAFEPK